MLARVWNNRTIRQREDGYICLTDMAQATGKLVGNYLRLESTKEYQTLVESRCTDLHIGKSIQVIQGGTPELQGTWGHRKIGLHFANGVVLSLLYKSLIGLKNYY